MNTINTISEANNVANKTKSIPTRRISSLELPPIKSIENTKITYGELDTKENYLKFVNSDNEFIIQTFIKDISRIGYTYKNVVETIGYTDFNDLFTKLQVGNIVRIQAGYSGIDYLDYYIIAKISNIDLESNMVSFDMFDSITQARLSGEASKSKKITYKAFHSYYNKMVKVSIQHPSLEAFKVIICDVSIDTYKDDKLDKRFTIITGTLANGIYGYVIFNYDEEFIHQNLTGKTKIKKSEALANGTHPIFEDALQWVEDNFGGYVNMIYDTLC